MATRTDAQSPSLHVADRHDLIRGIASGGFAAFVLFVAFLVSCRATELRFVRGRRGRPPPLLREPSGSVGCGSRQCRFDPSFSASTGLGVPHFEGQLGVGAETPRRLRQRHPLYARCTQSNQTRTADCAANPGTKLSPLPDSNRRPPPYHFTTQATTSNPRQRIWLVSAVSASEQSATDCHWLRLLGSINAPSLRRESLMQVDFAGLRHKLRLREQRPTKFGIASLEGASDARRGVGQEGLELVGDRATRADENDRYGVEAPRLCCVLFALGPSELDFMPWAAYNRLPIDATAFPHRRGRFLLKHTVSLRTHASQEQRQAARRWLARAWNVTHPYGSGGVYANVPDPELSDPARAYYGSNLDRLQVVKRNYDPDGVFHSGPAGSLLGAEVRTGWRTRS
jgi:hypothetical protein